MCSFFWQNVWQLLHATFFEKFHHGTRVKLVVIFIYADLIFIKLFLLFNVRLTNEAILAPKIHYFASCIYFFISLFITKCCKFRSQVLQFAADESYVSGAKARAKQAWFFKQNICTPLDCMHLYFLCLWAHSVLLNFILLAQVWPPSLSTLNTCHRKLSSSKGARVKLCFKKFGTVDLFTWRSK